MRKIVANFLNNNKTYPIITIIVASLYPLLYYYDRNYALIDSMSQLLFFITFYFVIPLIVYYVLRLLVKNIKALKRFERLLLPIINLSSFFFFIVISVYGFDTIKIFIALVLGSILGCVLVKHLKKVVVFQLILIGLVLPKLIPDLYRDFTYSKAWMNQPDAIENTVFKKRPNIYFIQPDGYANFADLKNSTYNFDNTEFESFLKTKGFKSYDSYRSNYFSTLSSNSSMFAMKHHYYGDRTFGINPSQNRRKEIVGDNPVLRTLKNNNYKTFLLLHVPYLLSNRPILDYDYCNISLDEVSYISRGFQIKKDLLNDTKLAMNLSGNESKFFFIESMLPSHITTHHNPESSVENERRIYLERLEMANEWLTEMINFIVDKDPEGLIVIAADHGGYVGLKSSMESHNKMTNKHLMNSIFTSALAIKWPNGESPEFDSELRSSVNLFRILFAYLGDDNSYLSNLQEDNSYLIIRKGAPNGVYQVLNTDDEVLFDNIDEKGL